MIASLASFTGQYSDTPSFLEKGKALSESINVSIVSQKDATYILKVDDGKAYEVMIRVEKNDVTDVFCPCSPNVCVHVIAGMFLLRNILKVKEKPFTQKIEGPSPATLLGNRLNNIVYSSRAADTKDGELEEMGQHTSLKDLSPSKLEAKAIGNLSGYDHHPIFNGAKRLLGAAIREYEANNHEAVFAVAKAILKSICRLGIMSNSADECCKAAIALLDELYNGNQTDKAFKQTVFEWLMKAWPHDLLECYSDELMLVIAEQPQESAHAQLLLAKIQERAYARADAFYGVELKIAYDLLKQSDEKAAREWQEQFCEYFLKELVEDAVKAGDYSSAKSYAARGLKGRYSEESRQWLYEIAVLENDTAALREHYLDRFLRSGSMDDYEEMRKRFTSTEALHADLPMILNSIGTYQRYGVSDIITNVLIRERIPEALLAQLQRSSGITQLFAAADILLPVYQEELLALLQKNLLYEIKNCKQRDKAKAFAEIIKQVRKIPGGKAMVSQMLTGVFNENPGWKVMKEELGKYM